MDNKTGAAHYKVIVIGGGQAGLSVGYFLKRAGLPFVILDANKRIGDAWRNRWDSLHLFTPAKFDGLAGMPFPASPNYFPTKDEFADYLESYAAHFNLPVRLGTKVDGLSREGNLYHVTAGGQQYQAQHVVVAMANYQNPYVPAFAQKLNPDIVQFHSLHYRGPAQFQAGGVLVVGAGNSGAEIALEAVKNNHQVWLSGRDVGHIPFNIEGTLSKIILVRLVLKFVFHRVLTTNTPIGRKARPKIVSQGGPLVRIRPREIEKANIKRVTKVADVAGGLPQLADQQVLDVKNVVWCTGFHPAFSWIHAPIFKNGEPMQRRGVVENEPGLYFVGLHFLYSLSSGMVHGVERDAGHVVKTIRQRIRAERGHHNSPNGTKASKIQETEKRTVSENAF